MQSKVVATVVANYCLWPAAHFINFRYVPAEHRCASAACPWRPSQGLLCKLPSLLTEVGGFLWILESTHSCGASPEWYDG